MPNDAERSFNQKTSIKTAARCLYLHMRNTLSKLFCQLFLSVFMYAYVFVLAATYSSCGIKHEWMNEWTWFKRRYHRNCCRGTHCTESKFSDGVECQRGNRWVFRCRQKEASDNVDRTLNGKEFQAREAATGNAQYQEWIGRWMVRWVLTYSWIWVDDEHPLQWIDRVSLRGMTVPKYHINKFCMQKKQRNLHSGLRSAWSQTVPRSKFPWFPCDWWLDPYTAEAALYAARSACPCGIHPATPPVDPTHTCNTLCSVSYPGSVSYLRLDENHGQRVQKLRQNF